MVHFFCNSSELENQYIKKSQVEPFLSHHFQLYLCVIWWWECVWYDLNVCDMMMRMCDMMMRMCVIWLLRMYVIWWTGCGGSIILSLNHKGRVRHICISKPGQHWFRLWLVACSAPSHYLKQWWLIVNWIIGNKFQWNSKQDTFFIQKR